MSIQNTKILFTLTKNPNLDVKTQELNLPMQQTPKPDAQVPDGLPPTFEQSAEL